MDKLNENKETQENCALQGATSLHPGDFEIGSLQSRAAARVLAQRMERRQCAIQVWITSADGSKRKGPLVTIPHIDLMKAEAERIVSVLDARLRKLNNAQVRQ